MKSVVCHLENVLFCNFKVVSLWENTSEDFIYTLF